MEREYILPYVPEIPIESLAVSGFRADAKYVTAQVGRPNKERARRCDPGFVAGTLQIDRILGILGEGIPKKVATANLSL